jgi:hypothetical protein
LATTPTKIMLANGEEIDATTGTCEGCGEPLASHKCGSRASSVRSGSARRTDPLPCPHCGGRLHMNLTAAAINAECLTRQYALDTGIMTDPMGRLPVLTLEMMGDINAWGKALADPPKYGKMESGAGGAATYAAMRPKTGRKKKAVAAAAGAKIEDLATEVTVETAATAEPTGKKVKQGKKGKKPKASKTPPVEALDTTDGFGPLDEDDEAPTTAAVAATTVEDDDVEGLEEIEDDEAPAAVAEAEQIVEARPAKVRGRGKAALKVVPKAETEPDEDPELEPFGAADVVSGEVVEDDGLSDRERRRKAREERRKQLAGSR